MACLRVYIDDLLRGVFTLFDQKVEIGRDRECALVLLGLDVARRHAVIHKDGRRHVIESTSTKPVRVQASIVASPVILNHGEIIQIGHYTLVYETSPWEGSGSPSDRAVLENDPPFVLSLSEAGEQKQVFPICRTSVRIGRGSDNDIVLRDSSVSHHHAILEQRPEGFLLRDLKSTNGTRVDGERCDAMGVTVGARIEIGKTTLYFLQKDAAEGRPMLAGKSALAQQVMAASGGAGPVRIEAEIGCETRRLAEEIHRCGPAPESPFVVIDCDALRGPDAMREIFDVPPREGAAEASDQKGAFNRLHKGTVFLERIDCLSELARSALWQMLRERAAGFFEQGNAGETGDRVIVSCPPGGCDVPADVDFYAVTIPPLRARPDDIPLLIESLGVVVAPAAFESLTRHLWPGNVYELQNTLERATITAPERTLQTSDLIFISSNPARR